MPSGVDALSLRAFRSSGDKLWDREPLLSLGVEAMLSLSFLIVVADAGTKLVSTFRLSKPSFRWSSSSMSAVGSWRRGKCRLRNVDAPGQMAGGHQSTMQRGTRVPPRGLQGQS